MKPLFYLLLVTSLFFTACNNASSSAEASKDMSEFAEEESFKEAHETPEKIETEQLGKMTTFDTPDGATGAAYAVVSEGSDKFLFVIQEWWGLNDHIKREADRLSKALDGVTVIALDMYDGKVADNPDDAGKYMKAVKQERAEAIVNGAITKAGATAKIATIGWCFGGGWSLRASILAKDQAAGCVMYYGMPVQKAEELAPLKADVLGIFAEKDGWITPEVVGKFEALADATGKKVTVHQFDAEHAFANPSSPRYDEKAAQDANKLAVDFLKEKLL